MSWKKQAMLANAKYVLSISAALFGAFGLLLLAPGSKVATEELPSKYSDSEFWRIVTEFSEPGGFFRSDNFVSNETTFQHVVPELQRKIKPGGVYLGVGPDQNFTYIVALKPRAAFIVDIRRQNMLEHLLYKALIEISENRIRFLSMLFSRPMPGNLPRNATTEEVFAAVNQAEANPELYDINYRAVIARLSEDHQFSLTAEDRRIIDYVYRAFFMAGPEIRYSFPNQFGWRRFPSYSELMLESDDKGENHSYMASEQNFQILKSMQEENRIVPLVGDFAGDKTLRNLGRYLKDHGATVSAFYTSNVEFYLFQSDDWRKFLWQNVGNLPLDESSTFIRAYFNNFGFRFSAQSSGARSVTLLDSMAGLQSAFDRGTIKSYYDIIERSR
jgi:hypothetical protein